MLPRLGAVAATCALPLALTACGSDDQPDGSARAPAATSTSSQSAEPSGTASSSPKTPSETAALLRAGRTGLKQVSGTVYSIESEIGGNLWEVEIVDSKGTKHEMYVSRDGNKVVRAPTVDGRDAKYRDRVRATAINFEEAVRTILAEVPGATFDELNLDNERGRVVWEADVVDRSGSARSLEIDAKNGKVLENKPDS